MELKIVEAVRPSGIVKVCVEPEGWGKPFRGLYNQAGLAGYECHSAYSSNNFSNPFQQADEQRYKGRGWWGEVFPDKIEKRRPKRGETSPGEGFIPVRYTTLANTGNPIVVDTWAPQSGIYIPVSDPGKERGYSFFVKDTLIPLNRVPFDHRAEAEDAFRQFNIPFTEISGFWRPDSQQGEGLVGRHFYSDWVVRGRFGVYAIWLPSHSGVDGVASRPVYKPTEPEVVARINLSELAV